MYCCLMQVTSWDRIESSQDLTIIYDTIISKILVSANTNPI